MNSSEAQRYVERRFPGFTVKSHMPHPYRNSKIFIFDLRRGRSREKIAVKISRNYKPSQVALEFENLSRFYSDCKDPQISSPEPLFVDADRGILAMRYVEGISLSYMLHEIKPVSCEYLNRAIDLSAIALARYHNLFCWPEDKPFSFDSQAAECDINHFLAISRERIGECNLRARVTPFFDFTSWNIIINNGRTKRGLDGKDDMHLYLIDFPRLNYVCTPHLDLARFRFGLELVKQFPPAKFLGINRWEVDRLFDRFLSVYCRRIGVTPNRDDLRLIGMARDANIRRAQDLTRKAKFGWQPRIEKAYLRTFSREWLDQKGVFAQWPGSGRVEKKLKKEICDPIPRSPL